MTAPCPKCRERIPPSAWEADRCPECHYPVASDPETEQPMIPTPSAPCPDCGAAMQDRGDGLECPACPHVQGWEPVAGPVPRAAYLPYLRTLRRIPDAIVLDMATREIEPISPWTCLTGWATREAYAQRFGVDAAVAPHQEPRRACLAAYGGDYGEWQAIFLGIMHNDTGEAQAVETAWAERVREAVG